MANYNNQRPGVYSSYSVTSKYATPRSALSAAVVCKGAAALAGTVYSITTVSEAAGLLAGEQNRTALGCCRILLESGVSKLWLSTVATDYADALALIEEKEGIGAVVCDASAPTDLTKLRISVESSGEKLHERVAYAGTPVAATALDVAKELCSERVVLCCPGVTASSTSDSKAVYGAAALAGYILAKGDPAANLNGTRLETLTDAEALTESEIQSLIAGGVTVLEEVGEHVECVRAVTTRATSGGAPDNTLRPLNTILIIDDVMRSVRTALKARLGGLRRHSGTLEAILSQVMVELSAKCDEGVIERFEAPIVRAADDDPSVCVVELAFGTAHLIDQIHITAHVEV